ncbi:uncharacterized protein LOC144700474 [Wolffia australiana]
MAADKEASVAPIADEDPVKPTADLRRERRRQRLRRAAYALVFVIVTVSVVLLPVGLVLYKVREPEMTMKSVDIKWDNLPAGVFLRVVATAGVKNTNKVTYHFSGSKTTVFWKGVELANAAGPGGATGAGKVYQLSLPMDLTKESKVNLVSLFDSLKRNSNVLQLTSSTEVDGHVNVFGLFKHPVGVFFNCTLDVDFYREVILYQLCDESVKL